MHIVYASDYMATKLDYIIVNGEMNEAVALHNYYLACLKVGSQMFSLTSMTIDGSPRAIAGSAGWVFLVCLGAGGYVAKSYCSHSAALTPLG